MTNISSITKKIDPLLQKIYSPLYKTAPSFADTLLKVPNGKFRNFLISAGEKIPTRCIFKAKFKLNFTPCMFNPLFPYIVEWAIWARHNKINEK